MGWAFALLILVNYLPTASAVVLNFQFGQNADLERPSVAGPNLLATNQVTVSDIAVGDGSTINVTAASTPANLNSADSGIGVGGNSTPGTGRLGINESVAVSFNRDVVVSGFTLNEVTGNDNCTYSTPNSGGTQATTSANVTGLSLLLSAGQAITFSTTIGDGIRIATLTVTPAGSGNDSFTVQGNSSNNALAVLTNDFGVGLTLTSVSTPANGTAAISGTNILYSPNASFVGSDTFTYTNHASSGANATWTVTVTVTGPAGGDQYQVLVSSSNNKLDVLRNDVGTGLTLSSITQPTHGTSTISGLNVLYNPAPLYIGTDHFTYTSSNGSGVLSTWDVNVDVRRYPNFVFVLADDQGWTGLSVPMDKNRSNSKSDYYRTPNMEALAAQSMRFSFGYSPAPNCSPSRCAVLTGRTPARLKFTDIVGRNNNTTAGTTSKPQYRLITPGKATDGIPSTTPSIAELLKSIPGAGYSAAHFGKWHIAGGGPVSHGFDSDANDGSTDNSDGDLGATINPNPKQAYGITDRAFAFLTSRVSAGAPFYLQTSHYAVHETTQTTQSSYDSFAGVAPGVWHKNRYYAGMTTDLDINVGRLLNKLDDLGLRNSTYVIYHSDNGAPQAQSENYPLRGYKPEVWEGGTRVPTFVRGPGVPANSQCDIPVDGIDFLPTIWQWATGSTAGLPSGLDGGSLVPTILSIAQGLPAPTNVLRGGEVVHHAPHYVGPLPWPNDWQQTPKDGRPRSSIHVGHYKLVANYEPGTIELYDLDNDIGEQSDLSPAQLAIKWQLWVRLRDYLKLIGAQMPTLDPTYPGTNQGGFVLPAATGPLGDADSDGLPDDWEFRELLTTQYSGSDDPSHSGITLAEQYAKGLDPLIPNSIRINTLTPVGSDQLKLTWNATPGSSFVVETSIDLANWAPAQTINIGDVFTGEITMPISGNRQFFRVRKQ